MKALFIGGIKSGKSINAENYILNLGSGTRSGECNWLAFLSVPQTCEAKASLGNIDKPTYLATTEFIDKGMKKRIIEHKKNRADNFDTIEEGLRIYESIKTNDSAVLVECVSMWINNMFYHGFNIEDMKKELSRVLGLDKTIVFVLNDVGSGIISDNELARDFVDASGILSQLIAQNCDEVYHTIAGISTRIK